MKKILKVLHVQLLKHQFEYNFKLRDSYIFEIIDLGETIDVYNR